ncbi:MAG: hypothetical protein ACI4JY_07160 [Oscillospiraceae bacterium]
MNTAKNEIKKITITELNSALEVVNKQLFGNDVKIINDHKNGRSGEVCLRLVIDPSKRIYTASDAAVLAQKVIKAVNAMSAFPYNGYTIDKPKLRF